MKHFIPAWAGSVIFHLIGLLLLMFCADTPSEIHGAPGSGRTDHVGIVLKSESQDGSFYSNETETFGPKLQNADDSGGGGPSGSGGPGAPEGSGGSEGTPEIFGPLTPGQKGFEFRQYRFAEKNVIGPTAVKSAGIPEPGSILGGGGTGLGGSGFGFGFGNGTGSGSGSGTKTTIGVFGQKGTGRKFAFVFDRSESMRDPDNRPIQAAKAELIQAIDSLQDVHQFLIIFYNEEPSIYPSGERSARLIDATDENKEAAKRYIQTIVPAGATGHERALVMAVRQNPDVIFLLTDGQEKDDLNAAEFDRISRDSANIQINVTQFGFGPEPRGRNNLKDLASQKGGQYQYIDFK